MVKNTKENIKCSKCGTNFNFTVWDSVNFTNDEALKEKVLSYNLFLATCPHCGDARNYIYPCLFHDMSKTYMIWFIPGGDESDVKAINNTWQGLDKEAKYTKLGELTEDLKYDNLRCVFNIWELKEKILINENDLDDRIIEILKVLLLANMISNKRSAINFDTNLDFTGIKDENTIKNIMFDIKEQDTYSSFSVNFDMYEDIIKNYADIIPKKEKNYMVIDRKWAINILLPKNKK